MLYPVRWKKISSQSYLEVRMRWLYGWNYLFFRPNSFPNPGDREDIYLRALGIEL